MPRLFIGIPVPDDYHRQIDSLANHLAGQLRSKIKWTAPGNSHITLQFLGDIPVENVPALRQALGEIVFPAFRMQAGGCGRFPERGKPRVLWTGFAEGNAPCAELAAAVADALEPLGFEKDTRPFKCHLTLGRVKRAAKDDWEGILASAKGDWAEFTVDAFILWESELKPSGAVYSVVEEFMLKDEDVG